MDNRELLQEITQRIDSSAKETREYVDTVVKASAQETREYVDTAVRASAQETREYVDTTVRTSVEETRKLVEAKAGRPGPLRTRDPGSRARASCRCGGFAAADPDDCRRACDPRREGGRSRGANGRSGGPGRPPGNGGCGPPNRSADRYRGAARRAGVVPRRGAGEFAEVRRVARVESAVSELSTRVGRLEKRAGA